MAKNSVAHADDASSTSSSSSTDDLLKSKTANSVKNKKQKKIEISSKKKSNKPIPVIEQKVGNGVESQDSGESRHLRTRTAILLLLSIFALSLGALLFVYYSFPHLEQWDSCFFFFFLLMNSPKFKYVFIVVILSLSSIRVQKKKWKQMASVLIQLLLFLQGWSSICQVS